MAILFSGRRMAVEESRCSKKLKNNRDTKRKSRCRETDDKRVRQKKNAPFLKTSQLIINASDIMVL